MLAVRVVLRLCVLAILVITGRGLERVPESVTLYSIDGTDHEEGEADENRERFHHVPVLGSIELRDVASRERVVGALVDAMREGDKMAMCFWPRHGVRIVENGVTTDYVICFECGRLMKHAHGDGGKPAMIAVSGRQQQKVLDEMLVAAGVPLAPK